LDKNQMQNPHVAVIIPCYNETVAIAAVIKGFQASLPDAQIYVYDNRSNDGTADVARAAGAIVGYEPNAGKGNVVRRMFSDVDADIYVMVDGDGTYDPTDAQSMINMMLEQDLDMVCGARQEQTQAAYRLGHRFGNQLFTGLVALLFGKQFSDMLTGYRVFSRRFVKSFPALSKGFEIETELTVHSLELRMKTAEVPSKYVDRPEGSVSKLNTVKDGFKILRMVLQLIRNERPVLFYGSISAVLLIIGTAFGYPVVTEYLRTGLVPRLPSAVLASAIMMLGFLAATAGLILDAVLVSRREMKRLHYLSYSKVRGWTSR
jgi:glycosyltransferase involved in cell wall biosynthesis